MGFRVWGFRGFRGFWGFGLEGFGEFRVYGLISRGSGMAVKTSRTPWVSKRAEGRFSI